jgi:hypothetical protein
MVAEEAIFFTGIACGAGCENGRVLTIDYLLPHLLRLVFVLEIHVLALNKATDGFAIGTFGLIKSQFRQWHVSPFDIALCRRCWPVSMVRHNGTSGV